MIYQFDISTPANTAQASAKRTALQVGAGVVVLLGLGFPPGAKQLLHLQIRRWGAHLWPSNPDGNFNWDGQAFLFPEHYPLAEAPYQFEALTWNDDTIYAHSCTIWLDILPREVVEPPSEGLSILRQLSKLILRR